MKRKRHGLIGSTKSRRHRQRIAAGVRAYWANRHAAAAAAAASPAQAPQPELTESAAADAASPELGGM